MLTTDKRSEFVETVNPGRRDKVSVLPTTDAYLFLDRFKKCLNAGVYILILLQRSLGGNPECDIIDSV